MTLREAIKGTGCAAAGFAAVEAIDSSADSSYRAWLSEGCHAGMDYLERHAVLRCHPESVMPGARTVISLAFRIYKPHRGSLPVAAYALGRDYHKALKSRLRPLCAFLEREYGARTRICVDSAPLPERYWAIKAGIASPGRNGAALVPGCGPYAFLCEVLTDVGLMSEGVEELMSGGVDVCLGCDACIRACPTGALRHDGTADGRLCLSYLSIEHKGDLPEDIPLREGVRFPLLGCDRCLAACPLSEKEPLAPVIPDLMPREEIVSLTSEKLLAMDDAEIDALTAGTALRRAGTEGLRRNARRALGK